eukprot:5550283-Prymnesium_polylepis.1
MPPVRFEIACPPGVQPGQDVQFECNGTWLFIKVPAGVTEGTTFPVEVEQTQEMLLSQLRAVIGDDSHNDDELRWLLAKHDGDIGSAVAE